MAAAFGGCHPDQPKGIGVGRDAQGNLIVAYRVCHKDAAVRRVTLLDANGTRAIISDDRTLWEISATAPTGPMRFVVGQTPNGFREDVPFAGLRDEGRLLWVAVESSELPQDGSSYFSENQLRTDRLRVGDAYQTEEEFAHGDACG